MAEPLKNLFSPAFIHSLSGYLSKVAPPFDTALFKSLIFDNDWEERALKQRIRHIAEVLKRCLAPDYGHNISTLLKLVKNLEANGITGSSIEYLFIPDFIEVYGTDHYDVSLNAMEQITQFTSCEYAIRPYILNKMHETLQLMHTWSRHSNEHVRRLSSEGCRPRLPWAMSLPALIKDPRPILPILENLKSDPSDYVRRSVANNLNDISRDHPGLILDISKNWKGLSEDTDILLKKACRTLLKSGNPSAMRLFGFREPEHLKLDNFHIKTPLIAIGDYLEFEFEITNVSHEAVKSRLEYVIYYLMSNGQPSRKIYQISERTILPGEMVRINRKKSFKPITTRRFHKGQHFLAIIVNGCEQIKKAFVLDP